MKKIKHGKTIVGFGTWAKLSTGWKQVGFLFNNRGEGLQYLADNYKHAKETKVAAIRMDRVGETTRVAGKSWSDVRA